ncbi:hypothetical protein GCM10010358_70910 [Streptomyces minutiscleroticus]|uniref:Uncharacterized protein n=1 Tax=Streptomyces minutiscleroticus TaxID=68238 RepID=A0A918U836_9ACTN|nr:hypothetical protein GCM10010358_70910 [Streptomyces minutiscleroticus]
MQSSAAPRLWHLRPVPAGSGCGRELSCTVYGPGSGQGADCAPAREGAAAGCHGAHGTRRDGGRRSVLCDEGPVACVFIAGAGKTPDGGTLRGRAGKRHSSLLDAGGACACVMHLPLPFEAQEAYA